MTQIRCNWCAATVTHDPRHITGCNCDPDAPQWCYITKDGDPKGLGQAKYTIITNKGTDNEEKQENPQTSV